MQARMLKQRYFLFVAGFTWISLMLILVIVASLSVMGTPHWQKTRVLQAKRVLFHDLSRALAVARIEAFLSGKPLTLQPKDAKTHNFAKGMLLCAQTKHQHTWAFKHMQHIKLTWHGFHGEHQLLIHPKPESLAMNGYFLLEARSGRTQITERWVVNRLGKIRVLRKHVA